MSRASAPEDTMEDTLKSVYVGRVLIVVHVAVRLRPDVLNRVDIRALAC